MSNLTKGLVLIGLIILIGFGLVIWKKKVGGEATPSYNSISREEIEMLLNDAAKNNPMILKRFADDPELKKSQLHDFKEMLAFASQAKADGLTNDPTNKQELENIRDEVTAAVYDHETNGDKGPMPSFGFITEAMVNDYWGQDQQPAPPQGIFASLKTKLGIGEPPETRSHEDEFNDFLNAKITLLKAQNPDEQQPDISDDEKKQAREFFAKTRIYYNEYRTKLAAGQISDDIIKKVNLQVKLQQAQFLMKLYSDSIADKLTVTDDEVDKYIADHKEFDPAAKRAQAQAILDRAKAGEDFAALANQYSEDPGNKDPKTGEQQGGLYKNVKKDEMMPTFEQAALSLNEGQVDPDLVETDYGFHIIKLERKLGKVAGAKDDTYDVRHILISTGYKDPDKPNSREVPVKEYVKTKLQADKEKALIDQIVAANNVQVPDDFTVPPLTDEQNQQIRQRQQQQMQQFQGQGTGPGQGGAPPSATDVPPPPSGGKPAGAPPPAKKK